MVNADMQVIEAHIITELEKSLDFNVIKHNHNPVTFLVPDCEYCKKFGNCFSSE